MYLVWYRGEELVVGELGRGGETGAADEVQDAPGRRLGRRQRPGLADPEPAALRPLGGHAR